MKDLIERLAEVISDDEIARVHGSANFGIMTPREVVNDGVRKFAVGYHSGHTQFCILREHGLITKPRAMSYDANLTKKGKKYARILYHEDKDLRSQLSTEREERERLRHREKELMDGLRNLAGAIDEGQDIDPINSDYMAEARRLTHTGEQ